MFRKLSLILLVPICALIHSVVGATAVVVRPMTEPIELSTSPTVRLVAHGPQSPALYRITLEVENDLARPLVFAPPIESLQLYRGTDGDYVFNRNPGDDSTVWVTWDDKSDIRFPLRRIKKAYGFAPDGSLELELAPKFDRRMEILPRHIMAIDLDFEIELEMPGKFTLHFDGVTLGGGAGIEKVIPLPVEARDILLYLRQLEMARERANRQAQEQEAGAAQESSSPPQAPAPGTP